MLAPRLLSPDALRTEPACSAAPFRSNPHNHPRSPFILSWLRSCAAPAPAFDCRGRNLFLRWARRLPFCRMGLYFAVSAEESTKWKWAAETSCVSRNRSSRLRMATQMKDPGLAGLCYG